RAVFIPESAASVTDVASWLGTAGGLCRPPWNARGTPSLPTRSRWVQGRGSLCPRKRLHAVGSLRSHRRNIYGVRSKVGLSLHRQTVWPCPRDHQGPLCQSGPSPSRRGSRGGYLSALSPEALYATRRYLQWFHRFASIRSRRAPSSTPRDGEHASPSARSPTLAVLTIIIIFHKSFADNSVMRRASTPERVLLRLNKPI